MCMLSDLSDDELCMHSVQVNAGSNNANENLGLLGYLLLWNNLVQHKIKDEVVCPGPSKVLILGNI